MLTREPARGLTRAGRAAAAPLRRSADGERGEQGAAEQERPETDLAAQGDPPRGQQSQADHRGEHEAEGRPGQPIPARASPARPASLMSPPPSCPGRSSASIRYAAVSTTQPASARTREPAWCPASAASASRTISTG